MKPFAFASLPLACGALGLMSLSTAASAADLSVCTQGCAFASIQAAVNAARSGDKINIGPGTYFENIVIPSAGLTLIGAGKDLTTVDGRFKNPVFTLGTPGSLSNQVNTLIGMTITHGLGTGGFGGGGVSVRGGLLVIQDSIVSSSRSPSNGGGIDISSLAVAIGKFEAHQLIKTMLVHNGATLNGGGIHVTPGIEITVFTSTIARNTAGACGGGMTIEGFSFLAVQSVSITDNTAGTDGGGVCGIGRIDGAIEQSVIANNRAAHDGGGVFGTVPIGPGDFIVANTP